MIPKKSTPVPAAKTTAPAPARNTAAIASASAEKNGFVRTPGKQPDFLLKYKQGKEGTYTRVVGLYENDSRDGTSKYLKGYDKDEGITWVVMKNDYAEKVAKNEG